MKKAEKLLKSHKTVTERASKYAERIAKSIEIEMIDSLKEQIEKIDDEIFDLENFSLDTNLNKGIKPLTKEEVEDKFRKIINLNYKKDLLTAELTSKERAFNSYFKEEAEVESTNSED